MQCYLFVLKEIGTVDYIWHSPQLKLIGTLSLPEPQHARSLGNGMPNLKFASDHFSCVAEFVFV